MPRRSLTRDSFFNPEFVCPDCLEQGTVAWLLARYRSKLFPRWLFKGWRGESHLGRNAWPPDVLMTLVLLRFSRTKMSRRASCRRAHTDLEWRAAMGLNCGVKPPSEKTVRDFEKFLRARHPDAGVPRFLLFHEHIVRLCKRADILSDEPIWTCDSTPMWCYGAVVDTVRLLGEGVQKVAHRWAQGRRTSVEKVARSWQVDWILAPSIKGAFSLDWKDKRQRNELITELAEKAIAVVERVRAGIAKVRRGKRKKLLKLCRNLMKVVEQNLEAAPEGGLQIAHRVATGRLISLTDPEARFGHKSDSKTFKGFKLHVLGDAVSGLILSLAVTPGDVHDGQPALRLVRRAKELCESMHLLLGDTAYGAARLRFEAAHLGVKVVAPPPKGGHNTEVLGKASFEFDLDQGRAVCPIGQVSHDLAWVKYSRSKLRAPRFRWPKEDCEKCPLAERCAAKKARGNSRLSFHPFEETQRALRAEWDEPQTRQLYKKRSQGERLINETVRRGARKAMAWGLSSAELQAYVIVMANNLSLLAKALADQEPAESFSAAA